MTTNNLRKRFAFIALKRMLYVGEYTIQSAQAMLDKGDDADIAEVYQKVIRARRRIKAVVEMLEKKVNADSS